MNKLKQYISLLLLTIFVSVKLVGLHEFTHSEDTHQEECEICEFTITSNEVAFIVSDDISFQEIISFFPEKDFSKEYSYLFEQNQISNALFSRPPPIA